MPTHHRDTLAAELYVRAAVTDATRESIVSRLADLRRRGTLRSVAVDSVPNSVRLDQASTMAETYARFDRWATTHGVDLEPAFYVAAVTSTYWGRTRRRVRLPVACLALRSGSTVVGVFPHTADDAHRTVADALEALETGRLAAVLPESAVPRPSRDRSCPQCGDPLVNAQGVRACYACHWDEVAARTRPPGSRGEPDLSI